MNREDQIIEYLEGNLSKSEAIAFEAKIAADEELKNDVELFKKVIQGIENKGAEELKEYLQKRLNEPEIRTNSRAWMYAAASVSILLLGYVAIFKYTQTGSIQKTTDFITLKDKSMNRLKFWKKSNQSDASESSIIKEKRSPYLDSIKMLEDAELIAVNKDKDYIISSFVFKVQAFLDLDVSSQAVDPKISSISFPVPISEVTSQPILLAN